MDIYETVRELISEDQPDTAIDQLLQHVKANNRGYLDDVLLLKSRLKNLNDNLNKGTLSSDSAAIEEAKIKASALNILKKLEAGVPASQEHEHRQNPSMASAPTGKAPVKPVFWVMAGALGLILFIIIVSNLGGDTDPGGQDTSQSSMTGAAVAATGDLSYLIGEYSGKAEVLESDVFYYLTLVIEEIYNHEAKGYVVKGGVKELFEGTISNEGDGFHAILYEASQGGYYSFSLFQKGEVWSINGGWESNDGSEKENVMAQKNN